MSDNKMRKVMAVGLTAFVVILFAILNLVAPIFGSVAIVVTGILWVSTVAVIYGED